MEAAIKIGGSRKFAGQGSREEGAVRKRSTGNRKVLLNLWLNTKTHMYIEKFHRAGGATCGVCDLESPELHCARISDQARVKK
jgi:hypothetical protein